MPEMESGSTLPRRQMARILTRLHERSGLTVKAVSDELELSYQVVWRMLTGRPCRIKNWHIDKMCEIYGASADMGDTLKMLVQEAKAKGWWLAFGDAVPGNFDIYIDLEAAASTLRVYELARIPGLLQVENYARAVIRSDPGLTDDEVDGRVELRMQRQGVLDKKPVLAVVVYLDEAVVRRVVGGPTVMAAQLRHLADRKSHPNVSVRVVPLTAGAYRGTDVGSFRILEFAGMKLQGESEPPVVYIEASLGSALYIDDPAEVEKYYGALADVERSALDETKSRKLILEIAKELTR
jgi:hypothetical protein